MASEQQVYRRIENLEKELDRRDKEYEKSVKDLSQKYKKEMHDLQVLQQKKLHEAEENARKAIIFEINKKEAELAEKLDEAEHEALQRYKQSKQELENTRKMLEEAEAHFEEEVRNICNEMQLKKEAELEYANEAITDANSVIDEILDEPHEAFYPNKFSTFVDAVKNATNQIKNDLCQAAIATAVSAKYAAKRFLSDVLKMKNLWKETFEELTKIVADVNDKLKIVEADIKKLSEIENDDLVKVEFNYFTKGEYEKFSSFIGEINEQINKCKQLGIEAYLKDKDAMTIDSMEKYIKDLSDYNQRIFDLCSLYNTNRNSYDERLDLADDLINLFEDELGYTVLDKGFEELDILDKKKAYVSDYVEKLQKEEKHLNIQGTYEIFLEKEDFLLTIGIEPYVVNNDTDDLNKIRYHAIRGNCIPSSDFSYIKKHIRKKIEIDEKNVECLNTKSDKSNDKEIHISNSNVENMKKLYREQKREIN